MGKIRAHDELDYFGYYLRGGLNFQHWDVAEPNLVMLSTQTTEMDDYYLYHMGVRKTPALKPSWGIDSRLKDVVQFIDSSDVPGRVEMSCHLLDLRPSSQKLFFSLWAKARETALKKGETTGQALLLRSHQTGETTGITVYVAKRNADLNESVNLMSYNALLRKHQCRADRWLGLLEIVGVQGMFAEFHSEPWHEDLELDALAERTLHPLPVNWTD